MEPISKGQKEHLVKELPKLKGKEKDKTIKRLNAYDRGFKKEED